jgi:hypothetical protein
VGFAEDSFRYPLELIPEKTQLIEFTKYQKYQIEYKGDHYLVKVLLNDRLVSFFGFDNPI